MPRGGKECSRTVWRRSCKRRRLTSQRTARAQEWRALVTANVGSTEPMSSALIVEPLARHRSLLPVLEGWFVSEWPAWYGLGGQGDIGQDLRAFSASEVNLPVGFVAFSEGTPVGAGALKAESIPTHKHLSPWAAAGFVLPERRGSGVGAALLAAMVAHAHSLGYKHVFCGTSTAESLLQRSGWSAVEVARHAGKPLTVFRSAACPLAHAGRAMKVM